jgi:hypothetical protein
MKAISQRTKALVADVQRQYYGNDAVAVNHPRALVTASSSVLMLDVVNG